MQYISWCGGRSSCWFMLRGCPNVFIECTVSWSLWYFFIFVWLHLRYVLLRYMYIVCILWSTAFLFVYSVCGDSYKFSVDCNKTNFSPFSDSSSLTTSDSSDDMSESVWLILSNSAVKSLEMCPFVPHDLDFQPLLQSVLFITFLQSFGTFNYYWFIWPL